ncbi:hypothetical protein FHS27_004824 [Rhodopirellula rubra]|uniref:FecR protein domain protein n=1 Tax=Aporhodopirellula rubra TaxID=980271 RepID=A0A7W5H8E4_9BACT|nr:FecR domain-containing protein [Aporhodopirellula rubra]MBB3208990.1 hypothetical protein [Aporhodopirellula rubra]
MSKKPNVSEQTRDLIDQAINRTISDEDFDRLQDAIENSEEALDEYVFAFQVDGILREKALELDSKTIPPIAERVAAQPSHLRWILAFAATLLIGLGFGFSMTRWAPPRDNDAFATQRNANAPRANALDVDVDVKTNQSPPNGSMYVARLVRMTSGVRWGSNSAKPDFLLRTRQGDRIEIEEGMVELEYFTGASIILHSPCRFVTTGGQSGRLESGRVTGKVDGGNFRILTPSANVLDMGTEFGVSLNETSDTDIHVFDGEVRVQSNFDLDASVSPVSLTNGMSARVNRRGQIDRKHEIDQHQFSRDLPQQTTAIANELSLVDLFSADSRGKFALTGVIAPNTGASDRGPWLNLDGPGHRLSNGFCSTEQNPYLDGVFIPSSYGLNVQIDSSGTCVNLPPTTGRTWGPVWSRRRSDESQWAGSVEDYWGTMTLEHVMQRLNQCVTGMIGIHANVGLTFDLDEVRRRGQTPSEFSATTSNLDNSKERITSDSEWRASRRFSADVRVFIDGQLRASQLDFTREDGELPISVTISDQDRFLTVVSTDAGEFDGFDHVVLIDPVLKLKSNDE